MIVCTNLSYQYIDKLLFGISVQRLTSIISNAIVFWALYAKLNYFPMLYLLISIYIENPIFSIDRAISKY